MLIRPPKGEHAARPVSSNRTNGIFGVPGGALVGINGSQAGTELRTSSLIVPLNSFLSEEALLQFHELDLGLFQYRDVRVGIFPEREEVLVGPAGLDSVLL